MRILSILTLLLSLLVGCAVMRHSPPKLPPAPPGGHSAPAVETLEQKAARQEGELRETKKLLEVERLAPIRTTLTWASVIATLGLLVCAGLAVAAFFWGLGFAWKIPGGLALGFAGILAVALFSSWALTHWLWIVAAVAALGAFGVVWALRHHLTVTSASRKLWDAVPDEVVLPAWIENLHK